MGIELEDALEIANIKVKRSMGKLLARSSKLMYKSLILSCSVAHKEWKVKLKLKVYKLGPRILMKYVKNHSFYSVHI